MGAERPARLGAAAGQGEAHLPGLDFAHLPAPSICGRGATAARAADPVVLLSIGRKVEKKDSAISWTPLPCCQDVHWRFEHIGAGELSDALKAQAERLGIAQRCTWLGAQPQKQVFAALARADLFVLASKKAADGDQDGCQRADGGSHRPRHRLDARCRRSVSFIEDGNNGLLVPPGAPAALAAAVARMIGHPICASSSRTAPPRPCARASPSTPASTGSPRRWARMSAGASRAEAIQSEARAAE